VWFPGDGQGAVVIPGFELPEGPVMSVDPALGDEEGHRHRVGKVPDQRLVEPPFVAFFGGGAEIGAEVEPRFASGDAVVLQGPGGGGSLGQEPGVAGVAAGAGGEGAPGFDAGTQASGIDRELHRPPLQLKGAQNGAIAVAGPRGEGGVVFDLRRLGAEGDRQQNRRFE